jgi:transcriptional regulator with XRE-family HTH domain
MPLPTPAIVPNPPADLTAAEPTPAPEMSPGPVVESPSAEPTITDVSAVDAEVSVDRGGLKPDVVAQAQSQVIGAGTADWADVGRAPRGTSTGAARPSASHTPFAPLPSGHPGSASAADPSQTDDESEAVRAGPQGHLAAHPVVDRSRGPSAWTEHVDVPVAAEALSGSIVALAAPRVPAAVTVAVDFGRAGNGWAGAIVFNLWLRRMLRQRRMSQRQLAYQSGVDHSTISRLVAGERTPSLATATKLTQALRIDPAETVASLGLVTDDRVLFPTQRVESALRGDEDLDDDDIRALMDEYLIRRARRRREREGPSSASEGSPLVPMTQNARPRWAEPHGAMRDSSERR